MVEFHVSAFCLPAAFKGKPVKLPSSGPGSMRTRRSSSLTISHEPTSSTFVGPPSGSAWAKAVVAPTIIRTTTRRNIVIPSERPARCRLPFRTIRFALEMHARRVLARQVFRVADVLRYRQPDVAVRERDAIPMLGERRLIAVRDPVAPEPPLEQVRRDHFQ